MKYSGVAQIRRVLGAESSSVLKRESSRGLELKVELVRFYLAKCSPKLVPKSLEAFKLELLRRKESRKIFIYVSEDLTISL